MLGGLCVPVIGISLSFLRILARCIVLVSGWESVRDGSGLSWKELAKCLNECFKEVGAWKGLGYNDSRQVLEDVPQKVPCWWAATSGRLGL